MVEPPIHFINPGEVAHFALSLHPPDLPHSVTLTFNNPSPDLLTTLSSPVLAPGTEETFSVAENQPELPAQTPHHAENAFRFSQPTVEALDSLTTAVADSPAGSTNR